MNVPFNDLCAHHAPYRESFTAELSGLIDSSQFILGQGVKEFEDAFANYCGCSFAVGVGSGTEALHLALRVAGIGEGDEVIIPAHTFIATALAVTYTGAKFIPVDIDAIDLQMTIESIEAAITVRTKAIVPVHMFGYAVDMRPLSRLAQQHKLIVIEDAAQAHGALRDGKRVGSFGDMGCFSFYPGKNLGALGDGGMIVTHNRDYYEQLCALRNYGAFTKGVHQIVGFNTRLDTLQALFLNHKLKHLDANNDRRRCAASHYIEHLRGVGDLTIPLMSIERDHVYHLFIIRTKHRQQLKTFLTQQGIQCGCHYDVPIHHHPVFSGRDDSATALPQSECLASETLSLPLFPEITNAQLIYVEDQIRAFFENEQTH